MPPGPAAQRTARQIALAALVLLAIVLRTVPLQESHDWDESVFLQHARIMVDGRSNYDEFHHRPPGLSALYALGFLAWDHNHAAHLVQGMAGGLSVLFGFLFARRTFGVPAAFAAAVMLGLAPYLVDAGHLLLTDVPALAAVLAAMWLFERRGKGNDFLAGIAFALAILIRYTSTFFGLYFLLTALTAHRWRSLPGFALGATAGLAPYLLWCWREFGNPLHPMIHARRIVTEWTAPVSVDLYFTAIPTIFPAAVLLLFVAGVAAAALPAHRGPGIRNRGTDLVEVRAVRWRLLVLMAWGIAFFINMASIPHKETRYLLPLAVPVVMVAAFGFQRLYRWIEAANRPAQIVAAATAAALAVPAFAPGFQRLGRPWIDTTVTEPVAIARYLRQVSTSNDAVYAAHFFPVLAYYSECKTISLLPFQDEFQLNWRRAMNRPGYLVYYPPERLGESHGHSRHFQPDRAFIDAHPEAFRLVQHFDTASVYRYAPQP